MLALGLLGLFQHSLDIDREKLRKIFLFVDLNRNIELKNIENIVSGGAKGADTLGEKFSKKYGLNIIIYKPNWNLHGKKAGILRNTDIVEKSTHMIAFPSKYGKGTQDSIRKAENKKIPIKVLYID